MSTGGIDHHYNRVYSHILKRYLLCALLPTGHLALEIDAEHERIGKAPIVESSPLDSALGPTFKGTGEERFHLNHPHFIFVMRSQNASTNTHIHKRVRRVEIVGYA